jgi:phosphoglycolate phosphatase
LSLTEAFTALTGPKSPIDGLVDAYKEAFAALRKDPVWAEPLYPGAAACLEWLTRHESAVLGIATGKARRGIAHLLDRHGWDRVFATIQTADDAPSKPHPAMIEQAMAEVGVPPEDTVMVGDSGFDMAMARAAGVLPIGVSWGFQPVAALREAGADHIVHSYSALTDSLGRFLEGGSHPATGMPMSGA